MKTIGDMFSSLVVKFKTVVNDLDDGKADRYSSSFTFDAINRTESKTFKALSYTTSNPSSINDFSLPSILVPVTVLIVASMPVLAPAIPIGVSTS